MHAHLGALHGHGELALGSFDALTISYTTVLANACCDKENTQYGHNSAPESVCVQKGCVVGRAIMG